MSAIIKTICEQNRLQYISSEVVNGGDINQVYKINTSSGVFFLKLNSAVSFPQMFQKEGEGLQALKQASLLFVPTVIAFGECETQQYLLLEWIEKAPPSRNFWSDFAKGLAQLHKMSNTHFGWRSSNYIGSLVQQNAYSTSWAEFYSTQRIQPLVKQLFDLELMSAVDIQNADKLCSRLPEIFPLEAPSLLHGDLWSGNYMIVKRAAECMPAIFDPAVYFGHREMDLGMSLLFGGFDARFYAEYNSNFPLENNWKNRVSLTQLYPLLVHAILFGGGYIGRCKEVLKEWK